MYSLTIENEETISNFLKMLKRFTQTEDATSFRVHQLEAYNDIRTETATFIVFCFEIERSRKN